MLSLFIIVLLHYYYCIIPQPKTFFCTIFYVHWKAEVSYLTVEVVWTVQFPDGSSSSAQIIMANQTHAVCVTLQHTPLYLSKPGHVLPPTRKALHLQYFLSHGSDTPIEFNERSSDSFQWVKSELTPKRLIDILLRLFFIWNCSLEYWSLSIPLATYNRYPSLTSTSASYTRMTH